MMTATFFSFAEWRAMNQDLEESLEIDGGDCPECDGAGETDCHCQSTCCRRAKDCEECHGFGLVRPEYNSRLAIRMMMQIYDRQKAKDTKALEEWNTIVQEAPTACGT